MLSDPAAVSGFLAVDGNLQSPSRIKTLSACGCTYHEAQSLHLHYGPLVALSTLNSRRYLRKPKTRFPVRRLHLLSGQEFHLLEAPVLA